MRYAREAYSQSRLALPWSGGLHAQFPLQIAVEGEVGALWSRLVRCEAVATVEDAITVYFSTTGISQLRYDLTSSTMRSIKPHAVVSIMRTTIPHKVAVQKPRYKPSHEYSTIRHKTPSLPSPPEGADSAPESVDRPVSQKWISDIDDGGANGFEKPGTRVSIWSEHFQRT